MTFNLEDIVFIKEYSRKMTIKDLIKKLSLKHFTNPTSLLAFDLAVHLDIEYSEARTLINLYHQKTEEE